MNPELLDQIPSTGFFIVLTLIAGIGPLLAIIATSFLKISVVVMLVRNAIGVQDVPPNLAVNSLALILSLYIMAPVSLQIGDRLSQPGVDLQEFSDPQTQAAIRDSLDPLAQFLDRHADPEHKRFFAATANRIWGEDMGVTIAEDDIIALVPAFTTSQLASAFETAFLLFLPFVAIDLIVSNILLSLGMIMLSPLTVSLPFKLLLFVVADGWTRLIQGLVLSYQ